MQTIAKPELLAPAGNLDALNAALNAGADAVYLGTNAFNARRNADNFDLESLASACDLAHLAGRKVYLALNTIILPEEMDEAIDTAVQAWRAGADALIVQDLGLLEAVHRRLPQVEIHASTQMNIHDENGVRLASRLGADRVTLAREMSLSEIETMCATGIPVEVFVHGALCICYSGQCLASSLIGGRSANRGLCAQPCRLPYKLMDTSTHKTFFQEGEYALSPKDLCGISVLPQLIRAGVSSLKIEGRMKSAAYVSVVTDVYRGALDRAYEAVCADDDASFRVTDDEKNRLAEVFSRGFSTAYMEGERGAAMMSAARPNNRGKQVGRIAGMRDGLVAIDLDCEVSAGDVLEFWTSQGRFAQEVFTLHPDPEKPKRVHMVVERPVGRGDRVFRVRNAQLLDEAGERFGARAEAGNTGVVPVRAQVTIRIGEPLKVAFVPFVGEGNPGADAPCGEATGPVVETARTKPITREDVEEHIGRTGNTPFSVRAFDIDLDDDAGLGFSLLHRLRRDALDAYADAALAGYRGRMVEKARPAESSYAPVRKHGLAVCVLAADATGAKAAREAGADRVYQHVLGLSNDLPAEQLEAPRVLDAGAIPYLGNIAHDEDIPGLLSYVRPGDSVLVGNLSLAALCVEAGATPEIYSSVPLVNDESLEAAYDLGARRVWLSPEIDRKQVARLGRKTPVELGLAVYGKQEIMVSEHCMLMGQGPCAQQCRTCPRRHAPHLLVDRKDYQLPVRTDDNGRGHLYNAVSLDLTAGFPDIVAAGVSSVMIDASLLTTQEIRDEVKRANRAAQIAIKSGDAPKKRDGITTGHFYHGVE